MKGLGPGIGACHDLGGQYLAQTFTKAAETRKPRAQKLRVLGGVAESIDLPKLGIHGNSHIPMMDDNSAEIAGMVMDWLDRKDIETGSS